MHHNNNAKHSIIIISVIAICPADLQLVLVVINIKNYLWVNQMLIGLGIALATMFATCNLSMIILYIS